VEEREIRARPGMEVRVEVLERVVEGDEDRQLQEHREAGGSRVDLVLPVELHQLLVLLLLVALVLLLDLLHLRRVALQVLHRVDLLDRERHEEHPHHDRRTDARPRPRQAETRVEPAQDVLHHRLELADDRDRVEDHRTGSKPPWLQGLQRSSRQPASRLPRTRPWRRSACTAYSEQEGWCLQVGGNSAPKVRAYSTTNATPSRAGTRSTALTRRAPLSARAARPPVRRATRSRSSRPPRRVPGARSARSRG